MLGLGRRWGQGGERGAKTKVRTAYPFLPQRASVLAEGLINSRSFEREENRDNLGGSIRKLTKVCREGKGPIGLAGSGQPLEEAL